MIRKRSRDHVLAWEVTDSPLGQFCLVSDDTIRLKAITMISDGTKSARASMYTSVVDQLQVPDTPQT